MRIKVLLTLAISCVIFSHLLAQSDSTIARQKDEMDRRMRILIKMMREDPKAARDSLAKARLARQKNSSKKRIEGYLTSGNLEELKELDLSNGDFTEVPAFVFEAKNLEVLILNDNRVEKLPKELQQLSKLDRIYWERNELGKKRFKIPKLPGVTKLDLSGNALRKLPKLKRLDGLKELVLQENEFESIPTWKLRKARTIKEVDLSSNPMTLGKEKYHRLDWLPVLKLNKCGLDSIHPSFYRLTGLEELQLQVNKLTSVPEGVSSMSKLTKLSFYKNELTSLPADLFEMQDLEVIDLYYNQLQIIPDDIGKMKSLSILYLSFNKLYSLSEEVGELDKLEELYLHHNRFSDLPLSLKKLSSLKTLHVNENYLTEFPSQILSLEALRDLDISNTDITSIPASLESMSLAEFYYRELDINYNNITNAYIQPMIVRMQEKGVTVSPRIRAEVVETQ